MADKWFPNMVYSVSLGIYPSGYEITSGTIYWYTAANQSICSTSEIHVAHTCSYFELLEINNLSVI